jgi:hypothetical protein
MCTPQALASVDDLHREGLALDIHQGLQVLQGNIADNWRCQQHLAAALPHLPNLLGPDTLAEHWAPYAFSLLLNGKDAAGISLSATEATFLELSRHQPCINPPWCTFTVNSPADSSEYCLSWHACRCCCCEACCCRRSSKPAARLSAGTAAHRAVLPHHAGACLGQVLLCKAGIRPGRGLAVPCGTVLAIGVLNIALGGEQHHASPSWQLGYLHIHSKPSAMLTLCVAAIPHVLLCVSCSSVWLHWLSSVVAGSRSTCYW